MREECRSARLGKFSVLPFLNLTSNLFYTEKQFNQIFTFKQVSWKIWKIWKWNWEKRKEKPCFEWRGGDVIWGPMLFLFYLYLKCTYESVVNLLCLYIVLCGLCSILLKISDNCLIIYYYYYFCNQVIHFLEWFVTWLCAIGDKGRSSNT